MLGKLLKKAKAERFPTGLGQQDQAEEQQFGALYLLGRCSSLALGIGKPTNVEKERGASYSAAAPLGRPYRPAAYNF